MNREEMILQLGRLPFFDIGTLLRSSQLSTNSLRRACKTLDRIPRRLRFKFHATSCIATSLRYSPKQPRAPSTTTIAIRPHSPHLKSVLAHQNPVFAHLHPFSKRSTTFDAQLLIKRFTKASQPLRHISMCFDRPRKDITDPK